MMYWVADHALLSLLIPLIMCSGSPRTGSPAWMLIILLIFPIVAAPLFPVCQTTFTSKFHVPASFDRNNEISLNASRVIWNKDEIKQQF